MKRRRKRVGVNRSQRQALRKQKRRQQRTRWVRRARVPVLIGVVAIAGCVATQQGARQLWGRLRILDSLQYTGLSICGNRLVGENDVRAALGPVWESSMFSLSRESLETQVKKISWVREAKIRLDLRRRLRVKIEERVPLAWVAGREARIVDETGVVLAPVAGVLYRLPVLVGLGDDSLSREDLSGLRAWSLISGFLRGVRDHAPDLWATLSEVRFDKEQIRITTISGSKIVLPARDWEGKLQRLRMVMQELLRQGKTARFLDFCYEGIAFAK